MAMTVDEVSGRTCAIPSCSIIDAAFTGAGSMETLCGMNCSDLVRSKALGGSLISPKSVKLIRSNAGKSESRLLGM